MADWPWKRVINPFYEIVKTESNAWLESFKPFTVESMEAFKKCDFARIASLAYPSASKEHLRTGCDLMNLFFVIDEYTDVEPAPVVRKMVDIVLDALNNPDKSRPEGEILLGELTRQFMERVTKTGTTTSQKHMVETLAVYLESVVQQAVSRDENTIPTIEAYLQNRRNNIGARPSFVILSLGLDLIDEVFYHPVIHELMTYIIELIFLDNDIASYNREQAIGDDRHNILTVIMHELNCNLEDAINWVSAFHTEIKQKFLEGLTQVPSWGPELDAQVTEFLNGVANWARANDCWNFESERYFGSQGREIQRTRLVPLYPKALPAREDPTLRQQNVVIVQVDQIRGIA